MYSSKLLGCVSLENFGFEHSENQIGGGGGRTLFSRAEYLILNIIVEEVIRRRLILDGDGTGEDRKFNLIIKNFALWCQNEHDTPDSR